MNRHITTLYVTVVVLTAFLCGALERIDSLERFVLLQASNTRAIVETMNLQVQNTDTLIHTVGLQTRTVSGQ